MHYYLRTFAHNARELGRALARLLAHDRRKTLIHGTILAVAILTAPAQDPVITHLGLAFWAIIATFMTLDNYRQSDLIDELIKDIHTLEQSAASNHYDAYAMKALYQHAREGSAVFLTYNPDTQALNISALPATTEQEN